jgi:hypothetical protein
LRHARLDFYLPHEYGGLGKPKDPRYEYVNTFPESRDLPVIKPKTTVSNKNEFHINIEHTADADVADMSLF